jgi:hypothetical protein
VQNSSIDGETHEAKYVETVRDFAESVWRIIRADGIQTDNPDCNSCRLRMWSLEFPVPYEGIWPSNQFFRITCNGSLLTIDRSLLDEQDKIQPIYVLEISIPGYPNTAGAGICVSTVWNANGSKSCYQPFIKSRSWMDKSRFAHLLMDACENLLKYIDEHRVEEDSVDQILINAGLGDSVDGEA